MYFNKYFQVYWVIFYLGSIIFFPSFWGHVTGEEACSHLAWGVNIWLPRRYRSAWNKISLQWVVCFSGLRDSVIQPGLHSVKYSETDRNSKVSQSQHRDTRKHYWPSQVDVWQRIYGWLWQNQEDIKEEVRRQLPLLAVHLHTVKINWCLSRM